MFMFVGLESVMKNRVGFYLYDKFMKFGMQEHGEQGWAERVRTISFRLRLKMLSVDGVIEAGDRYASMQSIHGVNSFTNWFKMEAIGIAGCECKCLSSFSEARSSLMMIVEHLNNPTINNNTKI